MFYNSYSYYSYYSALLLVLTLSTALLTLSFPYFSLYSSDSDPYGTSSNALIDFFLSIFCSKSLIYPETCLFLSFGWLNLSVFLLDVFNGELEMSSLGFVKTWNSFTYRYCWSCLLLILRLKLLEVCCSYWYCWSYLLLKLLLKLGCSCFW